VSADTATNRLAQGAALGATPLPGQGDRKSAFSRAMRWAGAAVSTALLVAALWVLHTELDARHLSGGIEAARNLPVATLAKAVLLTAASYLLLSLYEFLGLRYIAKTVSRARVVLTAFVSYALAHSLGFPTVTGAAVRYRLYGPERLSIADVAVLAGFNAMTLFVGFAAIVGVSLLAAPAHVSGVLDLSTTWTMALGSIASTCALAYLVIAGVRGREVRIRGRLLRSPGPAMTFSQLVLGVADLSLAATVLWVLLPPEVNVHFLAFIGIYAVACIAGVVSHVPGGAGVFESIVLLLLPDAPRDALVGALFAYRLIYYIGPLSLAAVLLGLNEIFRRRTQLKIVQHAAELYIGSIVPALAACFVCLAAVVLLLSGATPAIDSRLSILRHVVPLPVLELSHLAGSVIGVGLLILARALFRKVQAAYYIAFWLLVAGIVASLLKGLDIEEALLLLVALGVLYLGRSSFYRASSLLYERLTTAWIVSVVAVLILATYVGFVSYRAVPYSNDLWWSFALHGDASRMLRGSLAAAIAVGVFIAANLLGPPRKVLDIDEPVDAQRLQAALEHADSTLALAVFSGDKRVLMSASGHGFLMYQIEGHSWISLGDPVGSRGDQRELVWRFRQLSDCHGGRTVFYQVSAEALSLYVDAGLDLLKLGEEAKVPLAGFTLEGSARAELRQAHRRTTRAGLSFEIVPPEHIEPYLGTLRTISDAWLANKATAEKSFSVGSFSESYLRRFSIALVRSLGEPVAFANLWSTAGKQEISVDLMRFGHEAPRGTMDFLFVELMLWARGQGYETFNLGMAPLSGLATHPLSPLWHRVGNFVYRHGEHFYNFEGLRRYKAKFHPVWEPRYLASPGGLAIARVFTDISIVIAGGLKELVTK